MSIASRFSTAFRAFRFGFATILSGGQSGRRGFDAAKIGRLYSDWIASATSSDTEIRMNIRRLIDRSRDLERNNDYQRGYLGDCEDNIVGAIRQDLRMDCGEYIYAKGKPPMWQSDSLANQMIESAWQEWGKKGNCTICKRYSWRTVKRLAVRSVPRDGNFIARKILGAASGNRFGFALQIWEVDHLDLYRFGDTAGGGKIRFGIEYDASTAVVAYWLFAIHPGDFLGSHRTSTRFPADEIYHIFLSERGEQSIGIPWCVSAITRLRQLGAFEEAAVIAARLGASKAAFFKKTPSQGGGVGSWTGQHDHAGRAVMEVSPGSMEELPEGWDIASVNWEYPNIETGEFRKAMLRGVATSLRTSYTSFGNDLESVNFSSARIGMGDERETWKMHQMFFDEELFEAVFQDWLMTSILNGALNLPIAKFDKFNRPRFKGRRWPFLDPYKDVQASKEAIALRLSSRRQIIDENGGDVEDVFHDNVADENLAESLGLDLETAPPAPPPPAGAPAVEPDDPNADSAQG
jgi:lambda family phage portal protein